MTDKILLPTELTAENGAKVALIGEFVEEINVDCAECGGDGEDPMAEDLRCWACDGAGMYVRSVDVSWTTIKAIYAAAVEHFKNAT